MKKEYTTESLMASIDALLEVGNITIMHCGVCQNEKELSDSSECQTCK